MMRLPRFRYVAPATLAEAARVLAGEGPDAALLAGGTDLLPNMKRRQQTPRTLVALSRVPELRGARPAGARGKGGEEIALGACTTLAEIVESAELRAGQTGLWQAAAQIATPHLRNMGTLGGNICLDTRCNYYDQNEEWRRAIGFCMKKDGEVCWVAPGSARCVAVSSTDTAPPLIALGARVRLVSASGEREVPLSDLYRNDGIDYLARRREEILAEVLVPAAAGWKSTYWKLRRRGGFDFPVLSVAVAARFDRGGEAIEARVVLGAVSSRPVVALEASALLTGTAWDDETIREAASLAARAAKPLDNTDFTLGWRKKVAREMASCALREIRGDDQRAARERIVRHALISSP